MGLFADLIDKVVSSPQTAKAILYAIRDATAGAATDGKYIPLQVDENGYLRIAVSGAAGSGLATEAKQDDGNASLASIDAKTPATTVALPLIGDEGSIVYVAGPVEVSSIGGVSSVNAGLAAGDDGLPIRTNLDGKLPEFLETDGGGGNPDVTPRLAINVGVAGHVAAIDNPVPALLSDGATALGTDVNPIRTDPTGTTTQPVSDAGDSLTVDTPQLPADLESTRLAVSVGQDGQPNALDNPVYARLSDGEVSGPNSTDTPLGAAGQFIGEWVDVLRYASVSISVYTDQASAQDGFLVEWSSDGTNVDGSDSFTFPAGGVDTVYTFNPTPRFMRVTVTNGATPQTALRVQTILRRTAPKPSSHGLTSDLGDYHDAELVRAVLAAKKPSGVYTNIAADVDGNLVVTTPNQAAERSGLGAGRIVLASTTPTAVRSTVYTEQTTNAQRSIVSASASDTGAGTGARTVKIIYFAADLSGPFEETVTLSGVTPVNTVATNICFIEKMLVMTAGSGLVNAGIISLKAAVAGGGATIWSIAVGDNRTIGAHHYVGPGVTARITGFACGIKGADPAGFEIRMIDPTAANSAEFVITDQLRCPAGAQAPMRIYGAPVDVVGPARITAYVLPDSTSSRTYYTTFDFFEEVA